MMFSTESVFRFVILLQAIAPAVSTAFVEPRSTNRSKPDSSPNKLKSYAPTSQQNYGSNYLFEDFRTADGEIVNPYEVLNLDRNANKIDIKQKYRKLSKVYHPDCVRFADSLPKNCYDISEVREEWERISLAYTILSDKKQRLKYDRHSTIDEIGSVMVWGITNLKKGLFITAKKLAVSVDEGRKMSQKIEHSVAEMAVQMRGMELEASAKQELRLSSKKIDNDYLNHLDASPVSVSIAEKRAIVPPPKEEYYTPYEACAIIYEHEIDPSMNKPEAMKIMLEKDFVPVKRAQLYLLLNRFKDGNLTDANEWGRVGRPQVVEQ